MPLPPLTTANAALQIVSTIGKTLNAARERAQASKDTELKALVNALYDDFATLKEAVQRVTDENGLSPLAPHQRAQPAALHGAEGQSRSSRSCSSRPVEPR